MHKFTINNTRTCKIRTVQILRCKFGKVNNAYCDNFCRRIRKCKSVQNCTILLIEVRTLTRVNLIKPDQGWKNAIQRYRLDIANKLISLERYREFANPKVMMENCYSLSYFQVDFRDTDSQFWRWNSSRGLLYSLRAHVGVNRSANDHSSLLPFSMELSNRTAL